MNLFFRLIILIFKRLIFTRPLGPFDPCSTRFRVNPLDLDLNFHMNNGRYLSIMDLGRIDLMLRAGIFWKLTKKGFYPVVTSESIRFRKSLNLFQSFHVVTHIESWDEKDFYITQQFIRGGKTVAEASIKGRFKQRGKGSVSTLDTFDAMGIPHTESDLSDLAKAQKSIEQLLAPTKKST
ncbi:MAG: acyl-CoA thioesterase [Alphaproteobacteria bacterium]|nr:acyl-CoA thioesterase [Alphaproteobacteria bacterium]